MSTCPEKDIHSIYLDGELPASYVAEYEAHVNACPSCQATLERQRRIRRVFAKDAETMELTKEQMDVSWEKLESKLNFTRTVQTVPVSKKVSYFVAGIAAAAVLGVVLPMGRSKSSVQVQDFQPVARTTLATPATTVSFDSENALGNIQLSSILGEDDTSIYSEQQSGQPTLNGSFASSTPTSSYVHNASGGTTYPATYDVFAQLPEDVISEQQKKSKGFNFKFYSPFANISLEIGSGN